MQLNKKQFLTILFFFSLCCNIFSNVNTVKIHGQIKSSDNEIVNYGLIRIKNSNTVALISSKGTYEFNLKPGNYTFVVNVVGYESTEKKFNIKGGKTIKHNFTINPEVYELDEFVAEGKSPIAKIKESAFNAIAIDAKPLHNSSLDVASALDRISGVKLRETGGVGSDISFSLNGFSGRHIKFFIDGVPMDGFGADMKLNNLPINLVEHIEVYKGVVPVRFGSDALGGAINIVTNKSTRTQLDASIAYGSFNTIKTNVNATKSFKNGFMMQMNAFYNHSDNDYKVLVPIGRRSNSSWLVPNTKSWARRFNDKYESGTLIAKMGVVNKSFADRLLVGITLGKGKKGEQHGSLMEKVFGERHKRSLTIMPTLEYLKRDLIVEGLDASLTANYNFGYNQYIDTASYTYNWAGEKIKQERQGESGSASYSKRFDNNGNTTLSLSYKINERNAIDLNNVLTYFNRRSEDPRQRIETEEEKMAAMARRYSLKNIAGLSYKYDINNKLNFILFGKNYYTLHYSLEYIRESGSNDYVPKKDNKESNVYGYGGAVSYSIIAPIQFKLSYENTYRLPSAMELFGDGGLEWGNSELKPEQGDNVNLNISFTKTFNKRHNAYIDAGLIYRHITNYIVREVHGSGSRASVVNHGKVLSQGINLEGRYSYKNILTVGGNFTAQNVRDNEEFLFIRDKQNQVKNDLYKARVPNVPYIFGNLDLGYTFQGLLQKNNNLILGYNLKYVHEFLYNWERYGSKKNKSTIPTQLSHDISATYTMYNKRINLTLECNNITDEQIYDNFSFQKPGRNFMAKLRFTY